MLKEITIENKCIISIPTAISLVNKVIPQVEIELQKRCNRNKTFIVSNYEINVKYEKEKITFFISNRKLSRAIEGKK